VDAKAALADVRGYAAANRIRIGRHAWERMAERGAQYEDVRHALTNARSCRAQARGRWKVLGDDRDGDELVLIVVIEAGVIVVTVF
jgi:hypothetical protein